MEEVVDGEYQDFKSKNGAYVREHFFGKYPELAAMVAGWSDDEIWALVRGGHDPFKVYAAYHAAQNHKGQPTVILAKTVKGYGMGEAGEGQNITHQQKKMGESHLHEFTERFGLPLTDEQIQKIPFLKFEEGSPGARVSACASQGAGRLPAGAAAEVDARSRCRRCRRSRRSWRPRATATISTTMAFVRILNTLLRDKKIGKHVVPIVPDESRTFGMEGMFRQFGIFSQVGQLYRPQDADQLMFYKEDKSGQILQEGINEAGAMASWIAAATSYSTNDVPMIPFYIYYSMFGFQRIGDLAWAAGDMRARGFLIGGTSGRTTLNGEGLQHEDGHSHILSGTIPNCVSYDPTFAYEVAVIVQDGLRRMYADQEDVYYYITTLNENYEHPAMPEGAEEGIMQGHVPAQGRRGRARASRSLPQVQLLGCGCDPARGDRGGRPAARRLGRRRRHLERAQLHRARPRGASTSSAGISCIRPRRRGRAGSSSASPAARGRWSRRPTICASSPSRSGPTWPARYRVLGTDGFGRSDYRKKLRHFFEVDRYWVTLAALESLAKEGAVPRGAVGRGDQEVRDRPGEAEPGQGLTYRGCND